MVNCEYRAGNRSGYSGGSCNVANTEFDVGIVADKSTVTIATNQSGGTRTPRETMGVNSFPSNKVRWIVSRGLIKIRRRKASNGIKSPPCCRSV